MGSHFSLGIEAFEKQYDQSAHFESIEDAIHHLQCLEDYKANQTRLRAWCRGLCVGSGSLGRIACRYSDGVAEQNARPGLTNRLLGRWVRRVYTAFPEAASYFPSRKVRMLGNPVRRSFAPSDMPVFGERRRLLILGGSQGAKGDQRNDAEGFGARA